MTASSETQEIVVVTGASTGIGAATARELARRGFHVLAGVRRDRDADAIRGPGIEPLIIDITNPDHIQALATRVHGDPQGRAVRALVNNAAIQANVPVEAFAIDEWRRLFEVNLFGHDRRYPGTPAGPDPQQGSRGQHQLRGRQGRHGRLWSLRGTKFALEAVSDSLRREIAPFGVGVVVVEPGAVRTEMPGRAIATAHELVSAMTPEQSQRYGALVQAVNAQTVSSTKSGLPADAAAKVIAKAVTARKPRTRYTVGRDAALITRLARILPDRTLDRVLAAALRPHFPKESKSTTTRPPLAGKSVLVTGAARSIVPRSRSPWRGEAPKAVVH